MPGIFFLSEALKEARKGVGSVSPNPAVGAVLVRTGKIIARGFHKHYGAAHAETALLERAGSVAQGGHLYVTLEPCNHHGKTPPCTEAIIRSGVRKVTVGLVDPNKDVKGKGISRLRRAGIDVTVNTAPFIENFYRPYVTYHKKKRCHVTVKLAVTSDGMIADSGGASKWITGIKSRKDVHLLRHECDAILVGRNTAVTDNPNLTVRYKPKSNFEHSNTRCQYLYSSQGPVRMILTSTGRISNQLKLLTDRKSLTCIVTSSTGGKSKWLNSLNPDIQKIILPVKAGILDIQKLVTVLASKGIVHLLVEGGGYTVKHFLDAGCVDDMVIYISQSILYTGSRPAFPDFYMPHKRRFRLPDVGPTDIKKFGTDTRLRFSIT